MKLFLQLYQRPEYFRLVTKPRTHKMVLCPPWELKYWLNMADFRSSCKEGEDKVEDLDLLMIQTMKQRAQGKVAKHRIMCKSVPPLQ